MKEIDDTPLPETESELPVGELVARLNKVSDHIGLALELLRKQEDRVALVGSVVDELAKRVAHLETQRTPQDENDDPEWY